MPKYKDVVKQKEYKKKRREAHLKLVEESSAIRTFFRVVYGVSK